MEQTTEHLYERTTWLSAVVGDIVMMGAAETTGVQTSEGGNVTHTHTHTVAMIMSTSQMPVNILIFCICKMFVDRIFTRKFL